MTFISLVNVLCIMLCIPVSQSLCLLTGLLDTDQYVKIFFLQITLFIVVLDSRHKIERADPNFSKECRNLVRQKMDTKNASLLGLHKAGEGEIYYIICCMCCMFFA